MPPWIHSLKEMLLASPPARIGSAACSPGCRCGTRKCCARAKVFPLVEPRKRGSQIHRQFEFNWGRHCRASCRHFTASGHLGIDQALGNKSRQVLIGWAFFWIAVPLLAAIRPYSEGSSSLLTTLTVSICLLAAPWWLIYVSTRTWIFALALQLLLLGNYVLTPHASSQWVINWLLLCTIALAASVSAQNIPSGSDWTFQSEMKRILVSVLIVLSVVSAWTQFAYLNEIGPSTFVTLVRDREFNSIIAFHTRVYGLEKQHYGVLAAIVLMSVLYFWGSWSPRMRWFLAFLLVLQWPFLLGTRSLHLVAGIIVLYLMIVGLPLKVWTPILGGLCVLGLYVLIQFPTEAISEVFDRGPVIQAALNVPMHHPLGVGIGGYGTWITTNSEDLTATYIPQSWPGGFEMWSAPETDIAFFVISWGFASVMFALLYMFLFLRLARVVKASVQGRRTARGFVALASLVVLAHSVSQDFAGSLIWWIAVGTALGLVARDASMSRYLCKRHLA